MHTALLRPAALVLAQNATEIWDTFSPFALWDAENIPVRWYVEWRSRGRDVAGLWIAGPGNPQVWVTLFVEAALSDPLVWPVAEQ